jgi:ribosomal protein S18 acetylase RimI-like enzyme
MQRFVPYNPNVHNDDFFQMNIEYMTWIHDQLDENYQIDSRSMVSSTIQERAYATLEQYGSLNPPLGIVYIIEVDGDVAGMGALRKLNANVGEFKRMYNRPKYRGKGYGKKMVNKLLGDGRRFGCSSFLLDTAKFMTAAQHIYRKAGFKEIEDYPESEIPSVFRQYYIFMEKKE